MSKKYAYAVVPAWEYGIVEEEGLSSTGGVCLFVDKNDALDWGTHNARLLMPDKVVEVYVGRSQQEVPLIELYTMFYLMSVDVDLVKEELKHPLELVAEEDIPVVWFTKERIPTLCIIHTEKISI